MDAISSIVSSLRLLIAALLLAWACLAGAGELAATIIFASGTPRLIGVDAVERPALQGGELRSGETLDTGDGRVQLRFSDGASMSLQPATRFRVDDYVFAGEKGKAAAGDRGFFSLLRGGFRTLTGLIGKERREQYRVNTALATIGIRGTSYAANIDESGLSVRTYFGRVAVCNQGGCVEVGAGEGVQLTRPDERPRLSSASDAPGSAGVPMLPAPVPTQDISPSQTPAAHATPPNYSPAMTAPNSPAMGGQTGGQTGGQRLP